MEGRGGGRGVESEGPMGWRSGQGQGEGGRGREREGEDRRGRKWVGEEQSGREREGRGQRTAGERGKEECCGVQSVQVQVTSWNLFQGSRGRLLR